MNVRDANFLTFTRSLQQTALPTWADYEAAGEVGKDKIKRQWRDAWRDDAAHALLSRAVRIENDALQKKVEAERAERIRRMPIPLGPLGGYRSPLIEDRFADADDRDVKHALAHGDTWSVTPKQSGT